MKKMNETMTTILLNNGWEIDEAYVSTDDVEFWCKGDWSICVDEFEIQDVCESYNCGNRVCLMRCDRENNFLLHNICDEGYWIVESLIDCFGIIETYYDEDDE